MLTPALQAELSSRGLPTGGDRTALLARLDEALHATAGAEGVSNDGEARRPALPGVALSAMAPEDAGGASSGGEGHATGRPQPLRAVRVRADDATSPSPAPARPHAAPGASPPPQPVAPTPRRTLPTPRRSATPRSTAGAFAALEAVADQVAPDAAAARADAAFTALEATAVAKADVAALQAAVAARALERAKAGIAALARAEDEEQRRQAARQRRHARAARQRRHAKEDRQRNLAAAVHRAEQAPYAPGSLLYRYRVGESTMFMIREDLQEGDDGVPPSNFDSTLAAESASECNGGKDAAAPATDTLAPPVRASTFSTGGNGTLDGLCEATTEQLGSGVSPAALELVSLDPGHTLPPRLLGHGLSPRPLGQELPPVRPGPEPPPRAVFAVPATGLQDTSAANPDGQPHRHRAASPQALNALT